MTKAVGSAWWEHSSIDPPAVKPRISGLLGNESTVDNNRQEIVWECFPFKRGR